jgi:hypothetical protein
VKLAPTDFDDPQPLSNSRIQISAFRFCEVGTPAFEPQSAAQIHTTIYRHLAR